MSEFIDNEYILKYGEDNKDISDKETSYSPLYSTIGLCTDNDFPGIKELYFHYNRSSRCVFAPFIELANNVSKTKCNAQGIVFEGDGKAEISFYNKNSFLIYGNNTEEVALLKNFTENVTDIFKIYEKDNIVLYHGYSKNTDDRDPDETVPFCIGVKVLKGRYDFSKGVTVLPEDEEILINVDIEILDFSTEMLLDNFEMAPDGIEKAKEISGNWLLEALKDLKLNRKSDKENKLLSKAVLGLLYNASIGEGKLKHYISVYPNRGRYPTHFLWDSCFQNIALEKINKDLTEQSLLQFTTCQRCDGKYPQFLCSTWDRPSYTQPPLIGWALVRYIKSYENIEEFVKQNRAFLKIMLLSLEKNNEWWLTARMTKFGVIYCPHGLETGQDDSPRFDNGATLACDMNAFLLSQLRASEYVATLLNENEKSAYWKNKADILSENIFKVLYCEEDGIFYDCDVKTGKKIKILCCSCFFPLWAGVNISKEKADYMINTYLLSEKHFFGNVPFPSISYSDVNYKPSLWWRGPMWFPTSVILLETLNKCGYKEAEITAKERLYNILVNDGNFREHFNSETGEGLGAFDQGWTEAVFAGLF